MIGVGDASVRLLGKRGVPLATWRARLGRWSPPLSNRRFWATQVLVLVIAFMHTIVEAAGLVSWLGQVYFLPISLFFVPVVYAALYFGLAGSVATAVWCTLLSVPNWIFLHHGSESLGAMMQMAIIGGMAVFVGNRADQQMQARAEAEAAWRAGQESEARYRGLFETSGEGVVVTDGAGKILEANAAASGLLQQSAESLRGRTLDELLAPERSSGGRPIVGPGRAPMAGTDGGEVWIEPVETSLIAPGGVRQVVLRNITGQKRRQQGLETYAAYVVRGQEEERQRIAQELHDDTVQSLVMLWRKLDELTSLASRDAESTAPMLTDARDFTRTISESVRTYARGLRPPALDDLGLPAAIRRLVAEFSARTGVPAALTLHGADRRLPADTELALFRIAQESLRNTEKHALATSVHLKLDYRHRSVSLSVRDNGQGFPTAGHGGSDANGKLGLLGMEERARMAGGSVAIRSMPGLGTLVHARMPDDALRE